jgi:hypothetical protein
MRMLSLERRVTFQSGGQEIVGLLGIPNSALPTGAVILLHGLTNDKFDNPLNPELTSALLENGMISFRFDFFGSGESPGLMQEKTMPILVQNLKDAIDFIANQKEVKSIGVFGRSFGGTVAALCGGDPRVKAWVIASGGIVIETVFAARWKKLVEREHELEKAGQKLAGTGSYKGEFDVGEDWYKGMSGIDEEIIRGLRKMDRVLVIGTTPDEKVPLVNSTTAINNVRDPKHIHIFENTDHGYHGVEAQAVKMIVDWYKTYL